MTDDRKRPYQAMPSKEMALSVIDAIKARCTECPECGEPWNWTGNHQTKMHHAVIERNKVRVGVRKAVWAAYREEMQEGSVLTTTCENEKCVNPELMAAVHRGDVIRKMMDDGKIHNAAHLAARTKARRARGTKLSLEIAREIRASDLSTSECAEKLGVSRQMISRIRSGLSYRDANPFAGLGARR